MKKPNLEGLLGFLLLLAGLTQYFIVLNNGEGAGLALQSYLSLGEKKAFPRKSVFFSPRLR